MAYTTKLSQLKQMMSDGDYRGAIKLASSWGKRGLGSGEHAEAITRAWAAILNPQFYRDIGDNPDRLVELGVAAIRERYSIPEVVA